MDAQTKNRLQLVLANQVVIMCALSVLLNTTQETQHDLKLPSSVSAANGLAFKRLSDAISATRGEIEPPPFERDF